MSGAAPATGQALNQGNAPGRSKKSECIDKEHATTVKNVRIWGKEETNKNWMSTGKNWCAETWELGTFPPSHLPGFILGVRFFFDGPRDTKSPTESMYSSHGKSHYFGRSIWLKMEVLAPKSKGQSATWPRQFREKPHWKVRCSTGGFFSRKDWGPHTLFCSECTVFELETQVIPPGSTCPFDGPIKILDRPQCCGKIATICALQFALLRGRLHKNCWNPTFLLVKSPFWSTECV